MSNKCTDCGNNPMPHWLLYAAQTVVYIGATVPFREPNHSKKMHGLLAKIPELIGVSKWKDQLVSNSLRTKSIIGAAKSKNIPLQQEYILGRPTEMFRYKKDGIYQSFFSLPERETDDGMTHKKLDNKWHTKKILESYKTATPKGVLLTRIKDLKKCEALRYPVVIKPAQGSRGRHTHMFIQNPEQLELAFKNAKKIGYFVLCEEQFVGSVYRFTAVAGKTEAVLRGDYPTITGDGKSSIQKLIARKNSARPEGVNIVIPDESLLERQDLQFDSIPSKGKNILLGSKIGVRYGGDAVEVTQHVHESFRREIDRVAKKLDLFILGFDVIAENIEAPASTQKWAIIEINTIPFIDLHLFPRVGKPIDVASTIWDEIYSS